MRVLGCRINLLDHIVGNFCVYVQPVILVMMYRNAWLSWGRECLEKFFCPW